MCSLFSVYYDHDGLSTPNSINKTSNVHQKKPVATMSTEIAEWLANRVPQPEDWLASVMTKYAGDTGAMHWEDGMELLSPESCSSAQLKRRLFETGPVLVLVPCFGSALSTMRLWHSKHAHDLRTDFLGVHVMMVVGYEDTRCIFHLQNTWGSSWGNGGYCSFDYAEWDDATARGHVRVFLPPPVPKPPPVAPPAPFPCMHANRGKLPRGGII
jgi:hypothetical protein